MAEETKPRPDLGWAIVEIMGHNRYAGFCTEETVAGAAFLRVDVPECDSSPGFTKLFGAGSIYCISPCTEEVARSQAPTLAREMGRLDLPSKWRELMTAGQRLLSAQPAQPVGWPSHGDPDEEY